MTSGAQSVMHPVRPQRTGMRTGTRCGPACSYIQRPKRRTMQGGCSPRHFRSTWMTLADLLTLLMFRELSESAPSFILQLFPCGLY